MLTVNGFAKQESRSAVAPHQIRWHLLARISLLFWAFFLMSWIAQRAMH